MEYREYKTADKSTWGPGEWQDEPDKVQWQDEATGLPCLIVRGPSGALCGYVGIAEGHPLFAKEYSSADVEVHGGLTFADFCQQTTNEARHVCHVPAPGEPDHVWWFGFDCAHSWDICPERATIEKKNGWASLGFPGSMYRTLQYVKSEVTSLARQLKAAA